MSLHVFGKGFGNQQSQTVLAYIKFVWGTPTCQPQRWHVVVAIPSLYESSDLVCKEPPLFVVEERLHELEDDIASLGFCRVSCLCNGHKLVSASQSPARGELRHFPYDVLTSCSKRSL